MITRLAARLAAATLATTLAAVSASSALAQDWPNRPVRVIPPVASGAATELVGRAVADEVLATLKQPMVIENRPAGGGTQAAEFVAKLEPDGYTLFLATAGTMTILPHLLKRIGYDPRTTSPHWRQRSSCRNPVLGGEGPRPGEQRPGVRCLRQGEPPGKISYGSSGVGSTHHLAGGASQYMPASRYGACPLSRRRSGA